MHEGQIVGRIFRMTSIEREMWQWTQIGERAPTHGPNGGIADSLDKAKTRFQESREQGRYPAGIRRVWDAISAPHTFCNRSQGSASRIR